MGRDTFLDTFPPFSFERIVLSAKQRVTLRTGVARLCSNPPVRESSDAHKLIPSLHSPLDHNHYFSSEKAPEGMKAPLTLRQMHPEGSTLAFLIRFHGHQILAFGGMNYIEREIEG